MAEWYEMIIPIASLITASVAAITVFFLRKQMKITEESNNSAKAAAQIDAFLKIESNLVFDEKMRKIRLAISSKGPVIKKDGGPIEYEDFAIYLEAINRLPYFFNVGIIPEDVIISAYGPMCIRLVNAEALGLITSTRAKTHQKKCIDFVHEYIKKLVNDHKEFKEEIKEYAQSQLRTVQFKI